MKTLISVISDITKDIRRSTSLFLVIILGIAAAFSTHLISYGIVEDIAKEKRSYAVYNTISVVGAHSFDQNTYEKITSMPDVKNAFCFFTLKDADYVMVGWYGKSPDNWFPSGEGSFLSGIPERKEVYTSSNIAQYDPNSKKTVSIHGTEYEVVGSTMLWALNLLNGIDHSEVQTLLSYSSFVFVNLGEVIDMDISDACIRVQFDYDGNESRKDFSAAANDIFGEYIDTGRRFFLPSDPLRDYMASNLAFFAAIGCLCLLSYMNIIGMYRYHLSMQKRRFRIYMIVGARKRQMLGILVWKYAALFSTSFLIAVLVSAITEPLFELIHIKYALSAQNVIGTFLLDFVLTLLISLPEMKRICSPKYNHSMLRRGNGP